VISRGSSSCRFTSARCQSRKTGQKMHTRPSMDLVLLEPVAPQLDVHGTPAKKWLLVRLRQAHPSCSGAALTLCKTITSVTLRLRENSHSIGSFTESGRVGLRHSRAPRKIAALGAEDEGECNVVFGVRGGPGAINTEQSRVADIAARVQRYAAIWKLRRQEKPVALDCRGMDDTPEASPKFASSHTLLSPTCVSASDPSVMLPR
jgi:hypothetical protein